jgi:hypothetical protein
MHSTRNQAGLTFIGLILILIPVGFIVYIFMKAVPAYIEAYSVGDAINSLKKEIDLHDKSKEEIYKMIQKRFDVNDIHSVGKDDIKIQKTPNNVSVTVDYEARIPLFSNAALALSFHKSAVVR